ncbi:DUF7740 domain-containing protein [Pseudomonas indica]|uniref:DUF7740 domain-containing protein n=1 Tax=Pseudomonas indica TaxID=137658 RepID=UPI003FD0D18A
MDMTTAMLCLALADRIHGTNAAVIAAAYRVRPLVQRQHQPTISRIIRCRNAREWVERFLAYY